MTKHTLLQNQCQLQIAGTSILYTARFKGSRLHEFGHVKGKHDADWLKQCMKLELEETQQRRLGHSGYGESRHIP